MKEQKLTKLWNHGLSFSALLVIELPHAASANEKDCNRQTAERRQEEEKRIDTRRAIALAKASKDFESKTKGYKVEFHSIYFVHSFDPKACDYLGIESVNVVHALSQKDQHVKNWVSHLDAGLNRVTSHSEQRARLMSGTDIKATNWSGYSAAIENSSYSAYRPLNYVTATWTMPTISEPDTGDAACMDWCDVSVWVGLHADWGGSGLMAQAGTVSYRSCSYKIDYFWDGDDETIITLSCANKHGFVYDFLPHAAIECGDVGTIKSGHSVTASVLKLIQQGGGATNNYNVSIANNTTGKSCSATYSYSMSNASYASFITEATKDAETGKMANLPTFSDITITGAMLGWYEYDGAMSYKKYYLNRLINYFSPEGQADYTKFLMYANGSTQNIALGNVTSNGTFSQKYLTSRN